MIDGQTGTDEASPAHPRPTDGVATATARPTVAQSLLEDLERLSLPRPPLPRPARSPRDARVVSDGSFAHTHADGAEFEPTATWALRVLRRRSPVVVLCILTAVGTALAYSLHQSKQYTATASLLFNNNQVGAQIAGLQAVPSTNTQSQQDTNVQLLKLGDLAQRTADKVGHGLTKETVANGVTISPQGDTTVVTVSATMPNPKLAAEVANVYSQTFVNEQESADHAFYSQALTTVDRQLSGLSPAQQHSAQGLSLAGRAQSLATLAQLRSGVVNLAQSASPPYAPSSPRTTRNLVVATVLGLLFGMLTALGLGRFDQRIREPEELESIFRLPILGLVPDSPALKQESHLRLPHGAAAAAFQFIRAHLRYFNIDRDVRTLLVVSANPTDGKTTVAHRLAEAAAAMGSKVLLLEADLRRPTLAKKLGSKRTPGLAEVLIGATPLTEATQETIAHDASHESPQSDGHILSVVVAGTPPPNPAEMLESDAMASLLAKAASMYDLVIVDTPPLAVVSDAIPLLHQVDGVLIVARMGKNRRDEAKRLRDKLIAAKAPAIGVVANRVPPRSTPDYGDYDYRYSEVSDAAEVKTGTPQARNERETASALPKSS